MKKLIITNKQLKNIIHIDYLNATINLTKYQRSVQKNEVLFNNEVAVELIKNLKFINALQIELSVNDMLSNDLQKLASDIEKKCWKRETIANERVILHHNYFDEKLKKEMINDDNKTIKYSNQKAKAEKISNYFEENKIEINEYQDWKQNYFKNINEEIEEEAIDALEFFNDEINNDDSQNQPLTTTSQTKTLKL